MLKPALLFAAGLVLFIFGVLRLSSTLQKVVSAELRGWLKRITKRPIYGIATGTALTALFQSSSAVTVLTISLVSAGLLTFYQSLGVVMGANIGTTITAQLMAFKITAAAPFIMLLGFLLWLLSKGKKKIAGEALLYFGMLFFGLSLMSDAVAPLKENQQVITFLAQLELPLLALLVATLFTAAVQSSSITTALVVMLGQQHLISLRAAIPLILGANIGTTITGLLAAIGASKSSKRTALTHLFFNLIGVLIFFPLIPGFAALVRLTSPELPHQIANAHTIFNVATTFLLLPFLRPFSCLIIRLVPGKERPLSFFPEYLSSKALARPSLALSAAKKELRRQLVLAREMVNKAVGLLYEFKQRKFEDVFHVEAVVDNLQKEISMFLDEISKQRLSEKEAKALLHYAAMVDDIERIGDHATNLAILAQLKAEKGIVFSEPAQRELQEILQLVGSNLKATLSVLTKPSKEALSLIFRQEDLLDELVREAKKKHAKRLYNGICKPMEGPLYIEILDNLERISDHCENIAEYIRAH